VNIPNKNFQNSGGNQFITQKRIIIDDVNSFFGTFLEAASLITMNKDDDLMIQNLRVDDELFKNKDEQLYKLLSYSFMILRKLIDIIAHQ